VSVSVAGSGAVAMSHLDGQDVKKGVQLMVKKLKRLCHGAPEGRLSISFRVKICYCVCFCTIL